MIKVLETTLSVLDTFICVRYETGGTLLSAMVSLTRGLSCSTGGGTHHAGPDYGSGKLYSGYNLKYKDSGS